MVAKSRSSSSFRYVSLTRSSSSSAGMMSTGFHPAGGIVAGNNLSKYQRNSQRFFAGGGMVPSFPGFKYGGGHPHGGFNVPPTLSSGKTSHYYSSMWHHFTPPWNNNVFYGGRSARTAAYESKSSRLSGGFPPHPFPKYPCSKHPLIDGLPAPPPSFPLVPMYVGNLYSRKPPKAYPFKPYKRKKGCCGGKGIMEWWRRLMRRLRRARRRSKRKSKHHSSEKPPNDEIGGGDHSGTDNRVKKRSKKKKKRAKSFSDKLPSVVGGNAGSYYRWWEDDSSGFYGGGGHGTNRRASNTASNNNSRTSLLSSSRSRSNRLWFLDGFNPVPPPNSAGSSSPANDASAGGDSSLRCLGRRSLVAHHRKFRGLGSRDHWREEDRVLLPSAVAVVDATKRGRAAADALPAPPSATTASTIVGDSSLPSPTFPAKHCEIKIPNSSGKVAVNSELSLRNHRRAAAAPLGVNISTGSSNTDNNAAVLDSDSCCGAPSRRDHRPRARHQHGEGAAKEERGRHRVHRSSYHGVPPPPNRPLPPVPESRFVRVDTTTTTTTTTTSQVRTASNSDCERVKTRVKVHPNHQHYQDERHSRRRASVSSDVTHLSTSSRHRRFCRNEEKQRRHSVSVDSLADSSRSKGFVRLSRSDYTFATEIEGFLSDGVSSVSLRNLTGRLKAYMTNWVFMDRNRSPENIIIPPPPPPPDSSSLSRHGSLTSLAGSSVHSSRLKSKRHEVERRRCRRQRSKKSGKSSFVDQLGPDSKKAESDDGQCRWLTRFRRTNNRDREEKADWGTKHLSACAARLDELINNLTDSLCKSERMKRAEFKKARQRASVLWLVSKACENSLPNDLKDPYYRDHEDQDRLKPMIIQGLSTAALYCSALANIYADPNYHSLNHHGILQVLMRKGVHVEEPSDMPLTETVLTQTAPIRMSAHMAVIEGIMALFIKEVLIPEKVVEVVSRFSLVETSYEIPNDAEEAAVLWINKCCVKLQHRIEEEMGSFHSPEESDPRQVSHQRSPSVPIIQDLADLSDGCSLAAVLSFYCPDYLPWQEISFSEPVSLADSLYNLQLVQRFCEEQLPHDICFLTLEDFLYMHDSIKQCTLAFLADLMFLFEIRPARCVVRPGVKEDLEPVKQSSAFEAHRRHSHNGRDHRLRSFQQAVSPIPDLRSGGSVSSYGGSSFSLPDIHRISPRSNGPIPVREKTIERSPSARKIRGHEGSKSPISPTSSLRRTNSVNLPDSDRRRSKSYPDTVAAGLPSRVNHDEVKQKSDEDEEIAAYFTNRDTSLPFDANSSSQVRRELFPGDGQAPGNGRESLEPLRPAHIKQSKERSNHDTKVQERGEDRRISGPKEMGSSPEGHKIPEVIQRRKEVEEDYGSTSSPSHKSNPILAEGNSRLSTGLADYYQQLAEETHVDELGNKTLSGSPAKTTTWQKDVLMSKVAEFTEKAALENVDPYSTNLATTSFAQLSKLRDGNPNPAINIVYMQHDKEGRYPDGGLLSDAMSPSGAANPGKTLKSSFLQKSRSERTQGEDRHTSFATLPNTTTWQQQSGIRNRDSHNEDIDQCVVDSQPIAAQLNDIRLQLEERRRKIEQEKRRMETMLKKQRQKLGKAAFLQAVSKPGSAQTPVDGDSPSDNSERLVSSKESSSSNGITSPQSNNAQISIKDIENDIDSVTRKWLKPGAMAGIPSPDQTSPLEDSVSDDVINPEVYQNSIEQLNSSLSDIQADISRLSLRQYSIQDLTQNKRPEEPRVVANENPQQNFFLHKSASSHKASDFQDNVFQNRQQQQSQQPQGFVQSPRRGQWQPETPQNQIISNMYSQSPQQQISPQVINVNTSPRRGQWGQPLPPHMAPDQYQMPWQPPHPMRPASVEPQHMMHGHQMHHPAYDHRSPSAVPFLDSRNQAFPIHDGYGYQYPHQPGVYQNGPIPNQYDYSRGYGGGGNMPPQQQMSHYDPMGNYSVMNYPGAPHPQQPIPQHQISRPASIHEQSFRLGQDSQMNRPYPMQPQNTQMEQPTSNFQPIAPEREINYREQISHSQQPTSLVDDFGRPVRNSLSPERSPPSPPSKPVIGRTFRIPKGKSGGISPTKETSPPRQVAEAEEDSQNISQSPPTNGSSGKSVDGTDNTHFYISFDNDQPKKPKPKKPMRPREVKALSAASKVNGKQISHQEQGAGDIGNDTRKSPPLPTSLSGGMINTQSSDDSGPDGKPQPPPRTRTQSVDEAGVGFFIGADLVNPDPIARFKMNLLKQEAESEMQKKKELIMMMSLRRRAEQESQRLTKEQEYAMQKEQERLKQEERDRKKEEERIRRQQILENYRMRRQQEELEKDGGGPADSGSSSSRGHGGSRPGTLTKAKPRSTSATRPRPKSVHVTTHTREPTPLSSLDTMSRGSHLSLAGLDYQDDKDSLFSVASGGTLTHRTLSPQSENSGPSRQLTSPTSSGGGGSRGPYLPPGFMPSHHRTGPPSDGASDAGSTTSSAFTDYTGPKLFVKPAAKSNRGIILNAINTVLAGAVNSDTKRKVLEEINRSESKHFLILFRDSGCQFRAMYSYYPEKEEVIKLFGIGPKAITAKMMDRFYKYNSGGKCFSEVQTKHLTVTIDAITIQNHLWSGKKAMAQKKDLF